MFRLQVSVAASHFPSAAGNDSGRRWEMKSVFCSPESAEKDKKTAESKRSFVLCKMNTEDNGSVGHDQRFGE